MAILNPEHLLDQAERLIQPTAAGAARQVDLRRAVSASYYAVFHALLAEVADEFIGSTRRQDARYRLVYRSVDHGRLRRLCLDLKKPTIASKYQPYLPRNGLGSNIAAFATIFVDLQDRRHAADYDPGFRLNRDDAAAVIKTARSALHRYRRAHVGRRKAFLALIVFPPRTNEAV